MSAYWQRLDRKLTARAKRIYKTCFNKKFPKGWNFIWFFLGATDVHCKQLLHVGGLGTRQDMNTLCHELLHVRIPKMRHGKAFEKMVRKMVRVAEKVK
jgi:hypothetical protein